MMPMMLMVLTIKETTVMIFESYDGGNNNNNNKTLGFGSSHMSSFFASQKIGAKKKLHQKS